MKLILLLAGIIQVAAWGYYSFYSPNAPRVPYMFDHLEEKIEQNRIMSDLYAVVPESNHWMIDQAVEVNASYVEALSETGRRGWGKLANASMLLLFSGIISLLAYGHESKIEPSEIAKE